MTAIAATATATRLPTYSEIAQGAYYSQDAIPLEPNDTTPTVYGDAPIAQNIKNKKHKLERHLQQLKNRKGLSNSNAAAAVKNYFSFMNSVGRTQMLNEKMVPTSTWDDDKEPTKQHPRDEDECCPFAKIDYKTIARDRLNKNIERMG